MLPSSIVSVTLSIVLSFAVCSLGNFNPPEANALEEKDAQEGDTIKLTCRYDLEIKGGEKLVFFWQKIDGREPDLIAVDDKIVSRGYTLDAQDGRYDLTILSANYVRDNGHYECKIKVADRGEVIHTKKYHVTILIPPGPPKITPSKDIAKEGEVFRLTCSSEGGSPDPVIQWYKNNVPIQGDLRPGRSRENATSNLLEIKPTISDDRSIYKCTVWNRAIHQDETSVATYQLTVHYVPRVRVGPFNPLNVVKGSDAVMNCAVDANPPATRIRWYKNDRIISHEANHTVVNVVPSDSGKFVCVAENGVYDINGNSGRGELELSVQYAPVVTVASEKEVVAGEVVAITCKVDANPVVTSVIWTKERDRSFKVTGDTLRIDSVTPNDSGVYTCTASNHIKPSGSVNGFEQSTNGSIYLKVRHAPGNSEVLPANPIAISGRPFSLSCVSSPPGWPRAEFRWWREGAEKQELSRAQNLTFPAIHVSHEGRYYCQAFNSLGKGAIGSVYLTVNEAPSIIIPMAPTLVRKVSDKSFSLVCRGRSKPKASVTWYHNGRPVTDETGRYRIENREHLEDANAYVVQSQLHLESPSKKTNALSAMDAGRYACVFENAIGNAAKAESVLRVEHSPIVRHTYNKVAFDIGENATLQCKMSAYPEPRFEWSFHSKLIEPSRRYFLNQTSSEDDIFIGNLVINSVRQEDYGHYLCRSWNSVGDDEKTNIQLVKKSAPDAPTQVEAIEVLSDSTTLRWKEGFNGGYSNTEFIISYSLEGGKWKNESCRTMNPCRVTGLESRSEYLFKVLAINAGGQSPYSEEVTVTTKVNLKDMPSAYEAYYDSLTSTLSFKVDGANLPLVAKIEVRESGNSEWIPLTTVPIISDSEEIQLKQPSAISDMRIMLCLQSNDSWCGYEHLVKMDSQSGFVKESKGLSLDQFVMYLLLLVSLLVVTAFVVFFCCCCISGRKDSSDLEKGKNPEREEETAKARSLSLNQPYYPSHDSNKVLVNGDSLHHDHASKLSSLPIYATANPSGHLPQKYYLTGDVNDPSPSGSQETAQSDLWMMKPDANEALEVPISYQSLFSSNSQVDPNYPYYYTHEEYPDEAINLKNSLYTSYYDESQVLYGTTTHVPPSLMQEPDQHKLDEDEYSSGRNGRVIREIIV